jgi:hypothetical protein
MVTSEQPTERSNALRIAVIDEQIKGLREQQRAHNESAQRRFDRMEIKLDQLAAGINRGRGAYVAAITVAAAFGTMLIEALRALLPIFHA